jgi:Zn-dependent protease
MRSTWRLGKWRGIPIFLHWTVLLGLLWFYYQTRSLSATLISFAAFTMLLLAHELGHAIVALWRNVRVFKIQLYVIHGICAHDEPYHEEDDVLIAWGGVAAQFVLLVLALLADFLLPIFSPFAHAAMWPLLRVFIDTNLLIIVLNLIPIEPLDGAKAWRALPLLRERANATSWGARLRRLVSARQRARETELDAKSKRVTAEIIDKLKKGKSDA